MRELHAGHRAMLLDEAKDARERLDVIVKIDAEIRGTDPAIRGDSSRLGQHETGAADGTAAQMDHVPIGREPVRTRVLAHRRHHDAVAEQDVTNRERAEQLRRHARYDAATVPPVP